MNQHITPPGSQGFQAKPSRPHHDTFTGYESPQCRRYLRGLSEQERPEQQKTP